MAHWDDHASLADYDYASDGLAAPENDDEKRKLAYRLAAVLLLCLMPAKSFSADSTCKIAETSFTLAGTPYCHKQLWLVVRC